MRETLQGPKALALPWKVQWEKVHKKISEITMYQTWYVGISETRVHVTTFHGFFTIYIRLELGSIVR